jgi:4-hydroxybenzoate polyprenyltransferase
MESSHVQSLQRTTGLISALRLGAESVRPRDWVKNTFLFAALFFSKHLIHLESVTKVLLAFGLFCLVTGGVYLINDIWDRDEDKKHPQKSTRPIASDALPVPLAALFASLLLATALSGAFLLKPLFGFVTASYLLLNIAYSHWLKHVVIVDVFSIAAGFVLRVVAGSVVIDVAMSHWLLICTMLLALFLGFTKRRYELITLGHNAVPHRRVLQEYSPLFLDMMIGIVTSATLIAYTLYTLSDETIHRFNTGKLLLTVPFVLYGIFRYLYLVYHRNSGWSPAHVLLTDRCLLVNLTLWMLAVVMVIYFAS